MESLTKAQTTKRKQIVLSEGLCTCKWEPRGDFGLEGYQRNTQYSFERKECTEQGKYMRVSTINHPFGDTMRVITFNKIFTIDEEY